MIVDGLIVVPVYLDSRPQTFELSGVRHVLQLTNYLSTVTIDEVVFENIEYGGLPKKFTIGNKKRFIRFTTLPKGVVAGKAPAPAVPASVLDANNDNSQSALEGHGQQASASGSLNFEDLFQKLMASGILSNLKKDEPAPEVVEVKEEEMPTIDLSKTETLKKRSGAIVSALFLGMQCSSCGVRFPPEQTMKYSQHLDWHFRQNRRDRDASKKAMSRRWYYDVSDWIQYEEIEDLEEREKNWFEKGKEIEVDADVAVGSPQTPLAICPAGPKGVEETCAVCQDRFECFFNEDVEEWHLKNAVRIEEVAYHPTCYEDLQSRERRQIEAEKMETEDDPTDESKMDVTQTEEDEYVPENHKGDGVMSDFDDDVMVLSPQRPTITEILDDEDDENGYKVNEIEDTSVSADSPKTEAPKSVPENVDEESINPASVKVKQEKIDDSYDNFDPFEDVGTIEIDAHEEASMQEPPAAAAVELSNHSEANDNTSDSVNFVPPASPPSLTTVVTPSTPNIDGNISLSEPYAPPMVANKIKVNITKPMIVINTTEQPKESEPPEPKSPQEKQPEVEPTYELKSSMRHVQFKKLPLAPIGTEASGLCSIM